jgi:DNA-binding transcriptional LysR family regulator
MELRQIQYIMQLFKDGNITRASHKLFISQQGLSKSINRMEDELGFPLFERSSSGVMPTEAALSLYHNFDKVASSYQDLEKAIDDIRKKHLIKLMAYQGFALSSSRGLYPGYTDLHPESKIQYEEDFNEMLPDHLQSHKADLAFMLDPIPDILQSHLVIRQDSLCAVMNKTNPLALKQKLSLSDLHGQKLLFLDQLRSINEKILKKADKQSILYTLQGVSGIAEFLPLIHSFDLIGFASREQFGHFDFPEIVFLPLKSDSHSVSAYQVKTHLVTLRDLALTKELRQYIDYVNSLHK